MESYAETVVTARQGGIEAAGVFVRMNAADAHKSIVACTVSNF